MLTSAWLKNHPEPYLGFLEVSIAAYCDANIMPQTVEIDHIGLDALFKCLVLPAGFGAEVFYLDRSDGDEPNIHQFIQEDEITPPDAPVVRLLYRP